MPKPYKRDRQTHTHTDTHTGKVCRILQSTDCDDKLSLYRLKRLKKNCHYQTNLKDFMY